LLFYGGLGAILIAGVLDETTKDFAPPYALREREYAHDAEFVHRIEASVPANAMIFQLPYVPFVEEPPLNQMRCFDHGRPYLHSRTLRWSYAAMRGRGCALWQAEVAGQEPAEMIEALSVAGFEGIYVDRNGFADRGSELESELSRLLGVAPLESGNRQQSFFNMTGYNQKFRQQYSDPQWAALREASLRALQETSASAMGQTPYPTTGDSSAATSGAVTVLRTRIDRAARQVHLKVRLQNLGGTAWPPYTPPTPGGVTLALRQGSPGAPGFREAVPRFPLPRALLPGKERVFEVAFTLPEDSRPEPWYLDLVSEGVFWFSTRGSVPAEVRLTDQGSGRPEQSP
jgi:hypothetical protein